MILVTGGTGLLGAHLLYDLVSSDQEVRAIYRNKKKLKTTTDIFSYHSDSYKELMDRIEWVQADLTDVVQLETAMNGVDEIYHCAGVVSFAKKDKRKVLEANLTGTCNLVNTALDNNISKFCHVSSIASFGRPKKSDQAITEKIQRDENEQSSVYANSKYLAELEVWRGIEEGLNAVIVNPSTILGSGNWESGSSALFSRVYKGLNYYTEGVNGFVDVKDVVSVMRELMRRNIFKEQFIVVGENLSFKELFSSIAEQLDLKAPSVKVSRILSELVWRLESFKCFVAGTDPVITQESARIALDKQFYSNRKIVDALNTEFTPIKHSVKRIAADFRKWIPSVSG